MSRRNKLPTQYWLSKWNDDTKNQTSYQVQLAPEYVNTYMYIYIYFTMHNDNIDR